MAPRWNFSNNCSTTLGAAAAATDTTFTVGTVNGTVPPVPFLAGVMDGAATTPLTEVVTVTAVSGSTWTVTRGTEGTAQAHALGASVQVVLTAGQLSVMADPAWTLITSAKLGASAASIILSGIPNTYRALYLIHSLRADNAAIYNYLYTQFNTDTSTNYGGLYQGTGQITSGSGSKGNRVECGVVPAATCQAGTFSSGFMLIANYTAGGVQMFDYHAGFHDYFNNSNNAAIHGAGGWNSAGAAINRIVLTMNLGNFVANSMVALYGLA